MSRLAVQNKIQRTFALFVIGLTLFSPTAVLAGGPPVSDPVTIPVIVPAPKPTPTPTPARFTDAASFREYIFSTYGFSTTAQNFIRANSDFRVKDLSNTCGGGGGWIPSLKLVELNCAQDEAAVHELSHVWWHTYRLQNPGMAKGLAKDLVRLADGDGSTEAVNFAKGYVYGIGDWKGMYYTSLGYADVHNILDSDFDLTEAASRAKIIDWEIYVGLSSWTMGNFRSGSHSLPSYLWKYFEPEFTRPSEVVLTAPEVLYPQNNQTLDLEGAYMFKVKPVQGASGYLFGLFQNNVMIYENLRDTKTLSLNGELTLRENDPAHSRFHTGPVKVIIRASVNGKWTDGREMTINLRSRFTPTPNPTPIGIGNTAPVGIGTTNPIGIGNTNPTQRLAAVSRATVPAITKKPTKQVVLPIWKRFFNIFFYRFFYR